MTLKDHEKFWAFLVLIFSIVSLVILASTFNSGTAADVVAQGKLRIIDMAVAGLIAIAGMTAQALFRPGATAQENREAGQAVADAMAKNEPISATIINPPSSPIPAEIVAEADGPVAVKDTTGELPESAKL